MDLKAPDRIADDVAAGDPLIEMRSRCEERSQPVTAKLIALDHEVWAHDEFAQNQLMCAAAPIMQSGIAAGANEGHCVAAAVLDNHPHRYMTDKPTE